MRLIDADALMKKIREVDFVSDVDLMKITHDSMLTGFFHGSVQGIVDRLPIAYDPDKVVEQLEKQKDNKFERREDTKSNVMTYYYDGQVVAFIKAIEIVKGGAV